MRRVLLVEDSTDMQRLVARALESRFRLSIASSLQDAERELELRPPDLVLLDVSLPDGEGYRLCSQLQSQPETRWLPVIFLSARTATCDKVHAFSVGADDYVEKPFQAAELLARVEARLAKAHARSEEAQVLCKGDLRLEAALHRACRLAEDGERELDLTPHEFRLLHHLALHEDRVLSRGQLLRAVWGDTVVGERTVDTHLSNLRRKLGAGTHEIRCIRGVGYRFARCDEGNVRASGNLDETLEGP